MVKHPALELYETHKARSRKHRRLELFIEVGGLLAAVLFLLALIFPIF